MKAHSESFKEAEHNNFLSVYEHEFKMAEYFFGGMVMEKNGIYNRECFVSFMYQERLKVMPCTEAKGFVSTLQERAKLEYISMSFSRIWQNGNNMTFTVDMSARSRATPREFTNLMNCGCYIEDGSREAFENCLSKAGLIPSKE